MFFYLFGSTLPWQRRLRHAGLALLVTLLVAAPWILAVELTPAVWAAIPVLTCTNMTFPIAGPQPASCRPYEVKPFLDQNSVACLEQHREGARFMAATYDLGIAELGILETG